MILSASVTETRKASEVLLFFADVFDASKDKMQAALEQSLIPSVGDTADLATYSAAQTALADYYSKFAVAESSRAELCAVSEDEMSTDSSRLTTAAKLFAAQTAANVSARTAALPPPYPDRVEVTGDRLQCSE